MDRIFDVEIEGDTVLSDFDILDETGDINTASIQSFGPITVSADGTLNIDLSANVDNAQITGVVIRDGSSSDDGGPVVPATEPTDGNDALEGTTGDDVIDGGDGDDQIFAEMAMTSCLEMLASTFWKAVRVAMS